MTRAIVKEAIDAEFVDEPSSQASTYPCGFCSERFPAEQLASHMRECAATQDAESSTPRHERQFREGVEILEDAQRFSRSLKRPRNRMHKAHQDGAKVARFFGNIFFPRKNRE